MATDQEPVGYSRLPETGFLRLRQIIGDPHAVPPILRALIDRLGAEGPS